MHQQKVKFWFPAKTYGWGWGLPICWQGWTVMAGFVALVIAGALVFNPAQRPVAFVVWVMGWSCGLTIVCWLKGEKPGWHWGGK